MLRIHLAKIHTYESIRVKQDFLLYFFKKTQSTKKDVAQKTISPILLQRLAIACKPCGKLPRKLWKVCGISEEKYPK
ncbi:hypothetical protein IJ00_25220 [Calothrix sp. 336/3]|nr:hypothetical protein IJ00_25220 [Calothrix sp. 336/3]